MTSDNRVRWEGHPLGIGDRILSLVGLNSTLYEVIGDELIIKQGFFKRKTHTFKLSDLYDPQLIESLFQRMLKVGTIYLKTNSNKLIELRNLKNPEKVRKIFTDLIKLNNNEENN